MNETTPAAEDLAARVVRLEELVSHQQHTLEQLDAVAMGLQQQLDQRSREQKTELERLRYQIANRAGDDLPHEKPPHY